MSTSDTPSLDALVTPVAWTDAGGAIVAGNPALARWLEVSSRRLPGLPLAALEVDGDGLARALAESAADPAAPRDFARLRRLALAFPGHDTPRFADVTLARTETGWLF